MFMSPSPPLLLLLSTDSDYLTTSEYCNQILVSKNSALFRFFLCSCLYFPFSVVIVGCWLQAFGFVDGDLVEALLDLPREKARAIVKDVTLPSTCKLLEN